MRFRLRTLLIGLTACCFFFAGLAWLVRELSKDYYVVERHEIGNEREFIICGKTFWEVTPPFYYEIREGDRTLVRKCYFASGPDLETPKFRVVVANDGDALACHYANDPNNCRCVYEFSSGEGWPGGEMWDKRVPWHPETIALEKEVRERIEKKLRETGSTVSR